MGCSVFTRPSSISGKPVSSEMSLTAMPESRSSLAVPPVETELDPQAGELAGEVGQAGFVGDAEDGAVDFGSGGRHVASGMGK